MQKRYLGSILSVNENLHIHISYQSDVPQNIIDELQNTIRVNGLIVQCESRPIGVYLSMEWALPTLIIAYLAKPYFEGFLKEAGKHHYKLLETGLSKLFKQIFGPEPEKNKQGHSVRFSIIFKANDGQSVKFVFPEGVRQKEYQKMLHEALCIIDNYYEFAPSESPETIAKPKPGAYMKWSIASKEWVMLDIREEISMSSNAANSDKNLIKK